MEGWTDNLWAIPWEEYKKSTQVRTLVGNEVYVVETNSLGFRTREFSPRKTSGSIRVVCIGGSTTVQGKSNDTTYPAILEALLRKKHPTWSIEVLNLGISGIQSDHWPRRGYSFLDFEPDVVVQYEGVNDLLHRHMRRWVRANPYSAAPYKSVLFSSLFRFPHSQFEAEFDATIENIVGVTKASASIGALHVVGTFAAPDPALVDSETHDYLRVNLLEQWSTKRMPLYSYASYAALLEHFNSRLMARATAGYRISPVASRLRSPDRFVDICHMTDQGIEEQAAAFLPEVEQAVQDRLRARAGGRPGP